MFSGWLIKFGDVILPNDFILADGWESTPNQRIEIDAYRDANVLLHRETSENFKTSLTLNIRNMNLAEMTAFKAVIGLATLDVNSKKQIIQRYLTGFQIIKNCFRVKASSFSGSARKECTAYYRRHTKQAGSGSSGSAWYTG